MRVTEGRAGTGVLLALALVLGGSQAGLVGCSPAKPHQTVSRPKAADPVVDSYAAQGFEPLTVNAVAVHPLENGVGVRLSQDELSALTGRLAAAFDAGTSLDVLNISQSEKISRAAAASRQLGAVSQGERAVKFGQAADAQGVLYGVVSSFQGRGGSSAGTNQLAAFGFRVWLIDSRTGKTLWTAAFDQKDKPLTDNLFTMGESLRSGIGFETVDQLIDTGFAGAARGLEQLRQASRNKQEGGAN